MAKISQHFGLSFNALTAFVGQCVGAHFDGDLGVCTVIGIVFVIQILLLFSDFKLPIPFMPVQRHRAHSALADFADQFVVVNDRHFLSL